MFKILALNFGAGICQVLIPLLILWFLQEFAKVDTRDKNRLWLLSIMLLLINWLRLIFQTIFNYYTIKVQAIVRNIVTGAIYEKIIKLSVESRSYVDSGKITTALSTDRVRTVIVYGYAGFFIVIPCQVIAYTVIVIIELSWVGVLVPI